MPQLMIERVVPWTLNGKKQSAFLCTPQYLQDLAAGYLYTQGLIAGLPDIAGISGGEDGLKVALRCEVPSGYSDILERLQKCVPCTGDFCMPLSQVQQLCRQLLGEKEFFGTHRLGLYCDDQAIFREDVGRHNAADKCIAAGLRQGWDFSRCILGSTGRISMEMLAKAATAGIPIFFSRKYPSDIVDDWAKRLGIALVSCAHSDTPEVYGAAWRVRGAAEAGQN